MSKKKTNNPSTSRLRSGQASLRTSLKHYKKDDEWVRSHLEELVDKYAGQYVAVANQKIAGIDKSRLKAEKEAAKKYPHIMSSVIRIPHPEDFLCAL